MKKGSKPLWTQDKNLLGGVVVSFMTKVFVKMLYYFIVNAFHFEKYSVYDNYYYDCYTTIDFTPICKYSIKKGNEKSILLYAKVFPYIYKNNK